jgi:hypothetical protein
VTGAEGGHRRTAAAADAVWVVAAVQQGVEGGGGGLRQQQRPTQDKAVCSCLLPGVAASSRGGRSTGPVNTCCRSPSTGGAQQTTQHGPCGI